MRKHGLLPPQAPVGDGRNPDYVPFGSEMHRRLLGLVVVEEGDDVQEFQTYTSKDTGTTYRLDDEISLFERYADPKAAISIVLRQKVAELEAGPPPIPDNAPPLWVPSRGP